MFRRSRSTAGHRWACGGSRSSRFFIPEAVAVLTLSRRYPGEGGIYLWTRKEFGDAHGFLSGWCYWTNNLFYVPVLLVYMAGIFAFAGGEARAADLVNQKLFVAAVSFGWLALIASPTSAASKSANGFRTSAASGHS